MAGLEKRDLSVGFCELEIRWDFPVSLVGMGAERMPDKLKLGMIKESLWVERVGEDSRGGRNKMPWRKRERQAQTKRMRI